MKLAVIFPGIGYHSDKPLLYYSKKEALANGYNVRIINYHDLPHVKAGERSQMNAAYEKALEQADEQMSDVSLCDYEDVVFISKSLGTVVSASFCRKHGLSGIRHICFTPVEDTFMYLSGDSGIIFHGLSDPWCESSIVYSKFRETGTDYSLFTYENADHSLETGDVLKDTEILGNVMEKVRPLLKK